MKDKNDCMQILIIGRAFTDMGFLMFMRSLQELMMFIFLNVAFTVMMMLLTADDDDEEV